MDKIMSENLSLITAINENGDISPIGKLEAHVNSIHHVAVSVFIYFENCILLQRRAMDKYHSGGLWANACCSHPSWGESTSECAERRVTEELGVDRFQLQPMSNLGFVDYVASVGSGLTENERAYIFTMKVDADSINFNLNAEEVMEIKWINYDELQYEVHNEPERFSAWLSYYMKKDHSVLKLLRKTLSGGQ